MHAAISGTVDFHEPDDEVVSQAAAVAGRIAAACGDSADGERSEPRQRRHPPIASTISFPPTAAASTTCATCWRASSMTIRCKNTKPSSARRWSRRSRKSAATRSASSPIRNTAAGPPSGELQIGGVIYPDAADKAARFVMDCNQSRVPIVFLQDVQGFMVGKQAEQAGIIRAGAKLVNVVSNSIVPKLTVVIGGSFGAGNYALCGKAYDPALILAWPSAKYAVMGADQAAETLLALQLRDAKRAGKTLSEDEIDEAATVDPRALRRADRYPLRRGSRLGRRDHSPARNAALAANRARPVAGDRRRRVPHRRAAGVR